MYFLGVRGEIEYKGVKDANMDIAEYMHVKFDHNAEEKSLKEFNKQELKESVKDGTMSLDLDEEEPKPTSSRHVPTIMESTELEVEDLKDEDGTSLTQINEQAVMFGMIVLLSLIRPQLHPKSPPRLLLQKMAVVRLLQRQFVVIVI